MCEVLKEFDLTVNFKSAEEDLYNLGWIEWNMDKIKCLFQCKSSSVYSYSMLRN
jgi:hypothetical protein